MRNLTAKTTCLILVASIQMLVGCSQFEITKKMPWEKETEPPKAARILAIWSDTVLNTAGKPAMRGFGGRVFFYGEKDGDPIQVDGAVLVYAFDAKRLDKNNVAPEKKFVFPAKNMASHYSKCSLGHSYSFWLPWDKVGGKTRQVSLIVRFEGTDGAVVLSDASQKLLPGASSDSQNMAGNIPTSGNSTIGNSAFGNPTVTKSTETVRQIGFNDAPLGAVSPSDAGSSKHQ